jgi:hypothetical protein
MDHGKNKSSGSRDASKAQPPLALVIVLAVAGGVVIGSIGTSYVLSRPKAATEQSAAPAAGETSPGQTIAMPPQQQYTPAPQPPGPVPPGKVWSVEHGHWHDAPVTQTAPAFTPAPVNPAPTAPAPTEKKE